LQLLSRALNEYRIQFGDENIYLSQSDGSLYIIRQGNMLFPGLPPPVQWFGGTEYGYNQTELANYNEMMKQLVELENLPDSKAYFLIVFFCLTS
jgi:hypothetical protein